MVYPEKIGKGDVIEIISPSNGIKSKKIKKYEKASNKLANFGFTVIEDKYVRTSVKGVSSTAANRAREFNKALHNKNIRGLIACSGGDYIIQMMDLVAWQDIPDNIKWMQGQSDITPLLFYITTKYDIATIYSYNVTTFGEVDLPPSMFENNIQFLDGYSPVQNEYGFKISDEKTKIPWQCITSNKKIKGRIIGGCLDSLKDIIGTKYDVTKEFINKYKNDGIVWYFDVAEMTNEDILRTMWQFKQAGWFAYCQGILFGRLENEITYTNTTLIDAIKYNLEDLNIPIIINVDIGHTDPVVTIINGSIVKIEKQKVYTLETFLK